MNQIIEQSYGFVETADITVEVMRGRADSSHRTRTLLSPLVIPSTPHRRSITASSAGKCIQQERALKFGNQKALRVHRGGPLQGSRRM